MRTRVVILDHTAELGGAELALLRLCEAVDRAAVDLHVVLLSDGPLRGRLEAIGTAVTVFPLARDVASVDRYSAGRWSMGNLRRAGRLLPFVWRLARHLRRLRHGPRDCGWGTSGGAPRAGIGGEATDQRGELA